jgi:hypothetical protein
MFPHLNKMQPMQKNVNKMPADNQIVIIKPTVKPKIQLKNM